MRKLVLFLAIVILSSCGKACPHNTHKVTEVIGYAPYWIGKVYMMNPLYKVTCEKN